MNKLFFLTVLIFSFSCVQVPKKAVKLSATIGHDIERIYESHRHLANLYYNRLIEDVNNFIDDVYTPYQIQWSLKTFSSYLVSVITEAEKESFQGEKQKKLILDLKVYIKEIERKVRNYKRAKTRKLKEDKKALLAKIDEAYRKIRNANNVVTDHLSSIVKINNAQDEILKQAGLEDIRNDLSIKTSQLSDKIRELTKNIKEKEIDKTIEKFNKLLKE